MKPPYAIGSVPSLSGHAVAYRWRSLPRVRRHRASKPQGSSKRVLPWQITMDQLIFASLSHTRWTPLRKARRIQRVSTRFRLSVENEKADAGREGQTLLAFIIDSQARTGTGKNIIFLVQLTTSRIDKHARLIHISNSAKSADKSDFSLKYIFVGITGTPKTELSRKNITPPPRSSHLTNQQTELPHGNHRLKTFAYCVSDATRSCSREGAPKQYRKTKTSFDQTV